MRRQFKEFSAIARVKKSAAIAFGERKEFSGIACVKKSAAIAFSERTEPRSF
ncbi:MULTISPECIES: hypothetical protein [Cyanophyceae]|uniref:hypothetical protein n=1 Tax=Cyanophyceae TaxID=3028117 RepID=UPI00168523FB|nr:hypothetical protein [Trichocoleus sp. FACHB-40]MBD2006113.1 hypothetical protein [Trichocoleus sp. FACHB-40]